MAGCTRFEALDGWRGICACLVAIMHFHIFSHAYDNLFIRHAGLFVDFFFVLSSFVITHAYGNKLANLVDVRAFVVRRFGRLWPLHAVMLLAFVTATVGKSLAGALGLMSSSGPMFEGSHSLASIGTNVLLVQALGIHDDDTWNAPGWSISTEFYTYLIFALSCYAAAIRRRQLPWVVAMLVAAGSAGVVFAFSPKLMGATYDFGLWRCLYGFFIGHLAYRVWVHLAARASWIGHMEFPVIAIVVLFVTYFGQGHGAMAAPFVFSLVVICFAFEGGILSALLKMRPFVLLGKWSYSIYMVHAFIIHCLFVGVELLRDPQASPIQLLPMEGVVYAVPTIVVGGKLAGDVAVLGYLALVLATAACTYKIVEAPGRRFFNKLAARSTETRSRSVTWRAGAAASSDPPR